MKKVIFSIVIGLGMLSQANAFEGDAQAGKTKAAVCAACHGANGISAAEMYPNLAGQHADYIVKQLKAFKAGSRKDPVMAPMAAGLSEQDMADLGAYFQGANKVDAAGTDTASTVAAPAAAPVIVADALAGKALYQNGDKARGITACIDCHGKDGASNVLINPNLAKQHPEYLEKQLTAFKNDTRTNASMNQVAANLTETDIVNLGAYFKDTSAVGEITAENHVVTVVKTFTGDVEAGKAKAVTCAACHGADGNAAVPMYPSLAGQSEAYLTKQLTDFKKAVASNNTEGRVDPVMAGMVAPLSAGDIQNLAAYFAAQTLKPAASESNAHGQALYLSGDAKRGITACAACHSVDGKGMGQARFPAIAGQNSAYIKAQLEKFRASTRENDSNEMMRNISVRLSDDDIAALAQYVSAMK
ncbi:MAG: c-type cytochrome [Thalassotalea sp.]